MLNQDFRARPLNKEEARKRVAKIANSYPSNIRFSSHALEEMKKDNLLMTDILNVIKSPAAKILDEPEFEKGSYRYRLETNRLMVVIAFDSSVSMVVVTTWRKG